jgi:hypothetical protein
MMKKTILFLFCFSLLFAASGRIIDVGGATQNVTDSSAYRVYVDTFGSNPDFGMELCDVGQKYVAAVYSANISGTPNYLTVSKDLTTGSSNTLVYTSNGAGPCYTTPIDKFAFSQFRDFTRTPVVFVSAFPGRLHLLYSSSADGSSPTVIFMNYSRGWLRGSFSTTRSFTQSTGMVSASVTSITFETDSGSVTKTPSDAQWGLSSSTGRSLLLALCSDDYGGNCSAAKIINSSAQLPTDLTIGSVPVNDQHSYNRYVVVDGLGDPICIGADLTPGISANPSAITNGGSSNITITATNNGNVNITTDFNITLNITGPGGYFQTTSWAITTDLAPTNSVTRSYMWNHTGLSGTYTFTTNVDANNNLVECNENDIVSTNVLVSPAYYLHVWIDGNYTNTFPIWGRPYNITLYINDSDGNPVPNARYVITETNGLNPFTPLQVWNNSGLERGLVSSSVGRIQGNATSHVQFAVIPTCNKLYTDFSYLGVDTYVGNYSLTVNGYTSGGTQLSFVYNGTITPDYPLLIGNWTCEDPGWVNNKEITNKDEYVLNIYDWLYEVYSNTKKLVVP